MANTAALSLITLEAALQLHAAQGTAPRRFTMRAYDGGLLRLPNFGVPVVVDLRGMEHADQVKALLHHDAARPVGHMDRITIGDTIELEGVLSHETNAREIHDAQSKGFRWEASIGATVEPGAMEDIPPGVRVRVNNRDFTGPLKIARKTMLRESSFTGAGAGQKTAALVASYAVPFTDSEMSANSATTTSTTQQPPAGPDPAAQQTLTELKSLQVEIKAGLDELKAQGDQLKTEREQLRRERLAQSVDRFAAQHRCEDQEILATLRTKAAAGEIAETEVELQILRAAMGGRLQGFKTVGGKKDGPAAGHVLEAAMCLNAGWSEDQLGESFDEKSINEAIAARFAGFGPRSLLVEYLRERGHHVLGGKPQADDIRAALVFAEQEGTINAAGFSTLSLPGITSNVARKEILRGRDAVKPVIQTIARRTSTSDYKPFYMYRLNTSGVMEQVGPDGELKSMQLSEDSYQARVYPFGNKLAMNEVMWRADDMGAFSDLARLFGLTCQRTIEKTGFTTLLSSQSSFWTTVKGNRVASGGSSALSLTSLGDAYQLFLQMTDEGGAPIGVDPKYLVTAPRDAVLAGQLHSDTQILLAAAGDTDATVVKTSGNPYRGMFQPLHSPYLGNGKVTNANGTQFLLCGDPAVSAPIVVAFLDGRSDPQIKPWEAMPGRMGMQWDVTLGFGFSLHDDKSSVLSPGQ